MDITFERSNCDARYTETEPGFDITYITVGAPERFIQIAGVSYKSRDDNKGSNYQVFPTKIYIIIGDPTSKYRQQES